jgi:dolichol-phosphate mannosyltransferase
MKKLLVICPAFNEAEKLPKLLNEFKNSQYFNNLFVVNSGSLDNSEEILKDNNVNYITLPINKGGGFAIIKGIQYAIDYDYEICCIIAGNGKMDPNEIGKFIKKIEMDDYDFVQGSRYLNNKKEYLPTFRRLVIPIVTYFFSKLFKINFTDATCGFRAFKTDLIKRASFNVNSKLLYTYGFEPYLFSNVMLDKNIKKTEVPVKMRYIKGEKRYTKIRPFLDYPALFLPYLIAYIFPRKFN